MKTFSRKQKFDIMKAFIDSDAWIILQEEINRLKLGRENSIDSYGEAGEANKLFFNTGCKKTLSEMLLLPERIKNSSENVLKRLLAEVGQ